MSEHDKENADSLAIAFIIFSLIGGAIAIAICAGIGWFVHTYFMS